MSRPGSPGRALRHACVLGALLLAAAVPARGQTAPASCPPLAQEPTPARLQAAQQAARDRGFLWRIRKGGRTSWLYGTVHVGRLEWLFPGPAVRAALGSIDLVALELDLTDPAVAQALARSVAGQPDALPLSPALHERLARQIAAACIAPEALNGQHPVLRGIALSVLAARWEGLDPRYAQEIALAGAARTARVPIVSLETVAVQIGALIPSDPERARAMLVQALEQLEAGSARRIAARLADTWEQGRLDDLAQYERWCDCVASDDDRAALKRLNDDRNPGLAEGIDALHGGGRRVFAAVGALHMTGPKALPALMAQRGYEVERIPFPR